MVRNRERASAIALPHVEIVEGDFDRPQTLLAALARAERAFLLLTSSSERAGSQQIAFVDAARQSGVAHIAKLSQFDADVNAPGRFQRYHAVVEAALQASGLAYTILRPNLCMQGLLNFRSAIATQNVFYVAADDAKVSMVDVRDIAGVAVAALTEPGHEGKIYELTARRRSPMPRWRRASPKRWDGRWRSSISHPRPCATLCSASGFRSGKRTASLRTTRTIGAARRRLSQPVCKTRSAKHRAVSKNSHATTQPCFPDICHYRSKPR
jgi:hypothetical protein